VALDAGLRGALQRVLRGAAEVACLAAEIHARLDAATLARLATAWTSLADQVQAEDVPARRQALERRRSAIAAQLEAAAALQDAYERLLNRLTRLQCVFNALLGKALVLNVPLAAEDVETLEASLQTLREDLAVGRQVHAELGRAA
jgi:cell division protein FtsB